MENNTEKNISEESKQKSTEQMKEYLTQYKKDQSNNVLKNDDLKRVEIDVITKLVKYDTESSVDDDVDVVNNEQDRVTGFR